MFSKAFHNVVNLFSFMVIGPTFFLIVWGHLEIVLKFPLEVCGLFMSTLISSLFMQKFFLIIIKICFNYYVIIKWIMSPSYKTMT